MADRKITALSELTAPVATDVFPVVDVSEADNANKNKKIQLTTILKNIPNGTVSAPSVGFVDDSGLTGFFRVASNEIGITANQTLIGSFTTTGFQLGSGTPAAQLHLFSTDTTDQVIIENSDTGADNAPDLVLFRNSASPAANDNLGNLVYRGEDSAGNAHDYASIVASIETTTDGSEDGVLDIMSSASGTLASRIRLLNNKVGIGEATPLHPLHLTSTAAGIAFQIESSADDAASGADLMLVHRRGASGAGQDNDVLSTIFYRGKNDNSTPEEVDYAGIEAVIIDASDGTEDGKLNLQVMTAGTLTTKLAVDATGIDITGTVTDDGATHDGDVTFTGASANIVFDKSDNALEFADNAKATFGADADLQLYHDSNNSVLDSNTGDFYITSAGAFIFQTNNNENAIKCVAGAQVEMYYANSLKLQTTSSGVKLTGNLTGDDNHGLLLGTSSDFRIRHTGSHSEITDEGTGDLRLGSNRVVIGSPTFDEISARFIDDGGIEMYHNNVLKSEVVSTGFDVFNIIRCLGGTAPRIQFFGDVNGVDTTTRATFGLATGANQIVHGTTTNDVGLNTPRKFFIGHASNEVMAKFDPDGPVELFHDNTKRAETTSSGLTVTGTVTETSDIAFKSDIEPITNTLDKLQQITGYKYKLDNASIDSMGVIAQDVEKVFPELVHGDEGSKTLQYSGLIGVLVEAVKDLSAKVKALESN